MRKLVALLLAVVLCYAPARSQTRTITGKVTDDTGSPIPNVTVLIKGSNTGTTTAFDGTYSLNVPPSAKSLVFSAVGQAPQEVTIGNRTLVNVSLKSADKELQEVVVVGYGTQKRKDVTGSIITVKGAAVAEKPVQSFEAALGGRAAGVQISVPNGVLNNPPVFRIRGTNSISLSSYPLIVVDGIPVYTGDFSSTSSGGNTLASINPADIETIDIAKDAAAASIYGSRAANGVVFITTKKGKAGRARVNYNGWVGWTKTQRLPELLNAQQYTDLKNEGLKNANSYNDDPNDNKADTYFALTNGPDGKPIDTKWYDYVYRTGISHNHTINVSGANDNTNYYFSAGYSDQQGVVKRNDFKRQNLLFNIDQKVTKWFNVGGKINYSNEKNLAAASSGSLPGEAFATGGLGRVVLVLPPNVSPYNNDGTYNAASGSIGAMNNKIAGGFSYYNPALSLAYNRTNTEMNHVTANAYGQLKPFSWLTYRSIFSVDYIYVDNESFFHQLTGEASSSGGSATSTYSKNKRSVWTNTLSYDQVFLDKHTVQLMLGIEEQRSVATGFGLNRTNVADPYFTNIQSSWANIASSGSSLGQNYLYSNFASFRYNYENKYYLSGNVRQDEYSGLGFNNRKGTFYGASAGWEIANENFWTKAGLDKIFNSFRLRGSYGKVGNIGGIGNFESYTTYSGGLYGGSPTLNYNNLGNPALEWETSKKLDVGIAFGVLNDRISVEFNYYKNTVDGLILDVPQIPSAGIPGNAVRMNVGSLYNKGIELSINATPVKTKDFTWAASFNIGINKNRVTELAPGLTSIIVTTPAGATTNESVSASIPGYSVGTLKVVRTGGVDPKTGRRIFYNAAGQQVMYSHYPQSWQFADGSTSPAITLNDGVPLYNAIPKQIGGFNNTFSYKGFELDVLLTYQFGFYIYFGTNAGLHDQRFWNSATDILDHWRKEGDKAQWPRIVYGDNVSNGSSLPLDINVFKGDFIKLRNVQLSYSLPRELVNKTKLNSIRFYLSGQNLAMITDYPGPDPEVSSNGNNSANPSIDRNQVGNARTFTFGVNLGF